MRIALIAALTTLLFSCQGIVTTPLLGFLKRDISTLPPSRRIAYAYDVVEGGSKEMMLEAYNAIADITSTTADPQILLLSSKLAFGASGVSDILAVLLTEGIPESDPPTLNELFSEMKSQLIDEGAALFADAVSVGAVILDFDYILAGSSLLFRAAEANPDGFLNLAGIPEYELAEDYFDAGGAGGILSDLLGGA